MRITVLLAAAWFACSAAAPGQTKQQSDAAKPPFSVTITAAPDVVKVGAAPIIRIVLTNTSNHHINLTHIPGNGAHMYRVDVLDSEGSRAPTAKARTWQDKNGRRVRHIYMGGNSTTVDLDPGQTLKDECPLDERYDLAQPGKYTIQASRYIYETKTWVKSNTITVTVEP
jgi:hypothetical protein